MNDCVFCKIRDGIIPSPKLYEDEEIFVVRDIQPMAKCHYLVIPKKHFKLLSEMTADDQEMLGRTFAKIAKLAPTLGLENGYRIIINQGEDGGQTVFHLHIHVLGGEKLQ